MNRFLLFLLLAVAGVDSSAQYRTQEQFDSVRRVATARRQAVRADLWAMPRSEIRLGVGVPISPYLAPRRKGCPAPGIYTGGQVITPLFGVSYSYRVWRFLEVGGSLGYGYLGRSYYNDPDLTQRIARDEIHSFTVSVFARYAWANSHWVSAYSSVGLFFAFEYNPQSLSPWRWTNDNLPVLPDVTLIGVRVGRRLFGYIEPLCFNARGMLVQGGIGYKF